MPEQTLKPPGVSASPSSSSPSRAPFTSPYQPPNQQQQRQSAQTVAISGAVKAQDAPESKSGPGHDSGPSKPQDWSSQGDQTQVPVSHDSFEFGYAKGFGSTSQDSMASTTTMPGEMYSAMANPYWYGSFMPGSTSQPVSSVDGEMGDPMDTDSQLYSTEGYPVSSSNMFENGINWTGSEAATRLNSVSPEMQRHMAKQTWESQGPPGNRNLQPPSNPRMMPDFAISSALPTRVVPSNGVPGGYAAQFAPGWQRRRSSGAVSSLSDVHRRTRSSKASTASSSTKDQRSQNSSVEGAAKKITSQVGGVGVSKDKPRSSDRTTHNDVERKYRMNLKDKIAELKAAIPSLQATSEGESDGGGGAAGTPKVSKGTVLSKATEYIHELEQVNRVMLTEHHQLVQRLHELEAMLQEGGVAQQHTAHFSTDHSLGPFDPRGFS